jgi:hypothetical protein
VAGQPDRGHDQERAEDVEDPNEAVDQRRAGEDEPRTHDQRQDDADEQHLLLVGPRHRESGHDDHEHEQVVDGQAVFGEPAGKEFAPVLGPVAGQQDHAEGDGKRHVHADPDRRFLHRRLVRAPADDREVDGEERDERDQGNRPDEQRYVHSGLRLTSRHTGGLSHRWL